MSVFPAMLPYRMSGCLAVSNLVYDSSGQSMGGIMRKLNLAEWASVGEIMASVGVIVSLIFVAHSINTGANEVRASQTNVVFEATRDIELTVASDPGWSRILVQGRSGQEPLTEVDQHRYDAYIVTKLDVWDQMIERLGYGLMTEEEVRLWELYFAEWARRHLTVGDWQRIKWNFTGGSIIAKVEAAISGQQD